MTDLVKIARERVAATDQRTHWVGCERDHRECLIQRMADEIERLRAEIIELQTEADLSWKASRLMDRILTETVNILMGPPPVGKAWGWAGIPERTKAVMDRLDAYDAEKATQEVPTVPA